MKDQISPMPEAIDGKPWDVREGLGACNTVSRFMLVPLEDNPAARFVRNHEMGHARITPRVAAHKQCLKHDVSMTALQVCEDSRVHRFLEHVGLPCDGIFSMAKARAEVRKAAHSDRILGSLLVASLYTEDQYRIVDAMSALVEYPRRDRVHRFVKMVDERLGSARNLFRPIGFRNGTVPAARLFDSLFPPKEHSAGGCATVPFEGLGVSPAKGGVRWGQMQVRQLPASMTRRSALLGGHKTYRSEGALLAAVHRLPVDGRIFTLQRRQLGGTVLIDGSGSMSFDKRDLERILAKAPATTIAVYSGQGGKGMLTILSSKGRIATGAGLKVATFGEGNIIDGPALEWLAQQPHPRIWISDGYVTGMHDRSSVDLAVEAMRICRRAGIRRVERTESAFQLLVTTKKHWRKT